MLRSSVRLSRSLSFAAFSILAISALPSSAAAQETSVRVKNAKLIVQISDDFRRGRSQTDHFVTLDGKKYRLKFPKGKERHGLLSGMRVNLKGKKRASDASISLSAEAGSFEILSAPDIAVGGIRQSIVLKIQSATSVSGVSLEQLAQRMQDVNAMYVVASYGQLQVRNDRDGNGVADVFSVSVNESTAGSADAFGLCSRAESTARTQHGVDTSLYNHVVCVIPPDMNYTAFGSAYVPGRQLVISGHYAHGYSDGYVHEIGHNLGAHHSNTAGTEYGDASCVMGGKAGYGARDFNGVKKSAFGWNALTTAAAGTYELNAVEAQPAERVSSHNVLKVRDSVANQDLWISYRAPIGMLAPGLREPYMTSVYTYPGGSVQSVLVAALNDGQSYSQNGITITQHAHTGVSATVSIGAACAAAAPTLSASPAQVASATGESSSHAISLSNRDVNCSGEVPFNIAVAAPAGFAASLGSNVISAASGQTAQTGLSITPAAGTPSGRYTISLTASASGHPSATSAITYTLDSAAPTAVTSLSASLTKSKQVALKWSASSDALSTVSYRVFRNGAQIAAPSSASFNDSPPSGSHTYTVRAVDSAGNVSAAGNSVTIATSTSKGRPNR